MKVISAALDAEVLTVTKDDPSVEGEVTFEVTMKSGAGDLEKAKELARQVLAGL